MYAVRQLRVLQLGLGSAGRRRIAALAAGGFARVAGAADPDFSARSWAEEKLPGTPVLSSAFELLDTCPGDAAVVSCPHDLHADLVVAALERGLHVLCEKPLGTNAAEAARCLDAAARAGRILRAGANHLWLPSVQRAEELLAANAYGSIGRIEIAVGHGRRETLPDWLRDSRRSGGGTLKDNGAHALLLVARWWALDGDTPAAVDGCSLGEMAAGGTEGIAEVRLMSARGRVASVRSRWVGASEYEMRARVRCPRADLLVDGPLMLYEETVTGRRSLEAPSHGDTWALDTDDFLQSAMGLAPPRSPASVALACARVVEAAYESARTGQPVRLVDV